MTVFDLVGVPWLAGGRDPATGLDCWGVILQCHPQVPDYGVSPDAAAALARAWLRGMADDRWATLPRFSDGAVVAMTVAGKCTHAGIFHTGRIIHATRDDGVRADRLSDTTLLGYDGVTPMEWRP